jgi:outer membrane receptor protein involved in Fe transport
MSRLFGYVFFVLFSFTSFVAAQTFRGSVNGTITDNSGAAVAGAEVKVVSDATGLTRDVVTAEDGNYTATELPPGNYSITVTKAGFRTSTAKGIVVTVSSPARANITLSPGQVQEAVTVQADIPLIETTSNTMGGTIEGSDATELPVNGRDYTKLLVLVPGAGGDASGTADSPGSYGLFSINGNRGRSNNYLLDGTDMNDGFRNLPAINEGGVWGTPATILPVEALAEVPVISGAEAEYGRNAGAIVNLVTRSGTNTLHGSIYGSIRDNIFQARNYFNTTDQPQNRFNNNQFGLALGGPLVKDRTFWFLAYEGQREHGSLPVPGNVPSQADIANCECTINPVIQSLLDMNPWGIPLPATGNSVQFAIPFANRVDSMIAKIDQHIGKSDLFTGRYFFGDSYQSFPLGLVGGGGSAPGYNTVTPTRVQLVSLSYTKVITPALLLEFRGGLNRFVESFLAQDKSFNPASIGLYTLPSDATSVDYGMPLIKFGGQYSSLGANTTVPRGRTDMNWQYFTNASWTHGSSTWKFGYEFRRTSIASFFDNGVRGQLGFASLADFLAGDPTGSSRSATAETRRHTFQNNEAFYVQDNWRASKRLTLNLGLRWDYYGVIGEKNHLFTILDANANLISPKQLYPKDLNNFAPRVSLAYDVFGNSKTVVRAGWGLFYDAFSQDFFVGQQPWPTYNAGPAFNNIGFVFSANQIDPNINNHTPVYTDYSTSDVFTVDQKLRTPYVQNYNVNIERQLGSNFAWQVGYVGSAGRKLFRYTDINQKRPDGTYPLDYGYVLNFQSTAASSYNSLQTSLRSRNWHGLTSTLNYTWGRSIDDASDGQDYVPNAAQPDNSYNPRGERANSNFDTRHRVQFLWNYDIPRFGGMQMLTAGWGLHSIFTYNSGQPYNLTYLFDGYGSGDYNGNGEYYGRPDKIGTPLKGSGPNLLDLSAFAAPCSWSTTDPNTGDCMPGTEHFGNVGRNAFAGPHYADIDFGIGKNTKLGERVNMEIRVDIFNILNHPNFGNPLMPNFSTDMFTNGAQVLGNRLAGTGYLTSAGTPDVVAGNPYLGGGGPRDVQFGLKFSF